MSMKYCPKCNSMKEAKDMIKRVKKTVISGAYSSGCSIRTYYYCPECVPVSDEDIPKATMIVGSVISC